MVVRPTKLHSHSRYLSVCKYTHNLNNWTWHPWLELKRGLGGLSKGLGALEVRVENENGQGEGHDLGRVLCWGDLGLDDVGHRSGEIWLGRACLPMAEVIWAVLLIWNMCLPVSTWQGKSLCYLSITSSSQFQWWQARSTLGNAGCSGGWTRQPQKSWNTSRYIILSN